MKKIAAIALLLILAPLAHSGTDTGAALGSGRTVGSASDVREAIALSILAWATHPTDPLAANCVGAGDPAPCCTAAGVGASCLPCGGGDCCNAPATTTECLAFARDFILPAASGYPSLSGWAFKVERQCVDDVDWICNPQYFPGQGDGFTPAAAMSATNVIDDDVASWLSNLAADQILP